jgi:hypothetical protein
VACRENLQDLRLLWRGEVTLGPWLRGCSALTQLRARCNTINLEGGLGLLPPLQYLNLADSRVARMASLPTGLTMLDLNHCRLQALPASLSSLQSLRVLYLTNNWLWAADLGPLSTLTALQSLSLSWNELEALPASIAALTSLERLYLPGASAPLSDFSVLQPLSRLQVLSLSECGLPSLTLFPSMTALRKLSVYGNRCSGVVDGPWVHRLERIAVEFSELHHFVGALSGAHCLHSLYIARTSQEELSEEQCDLVLQGLAQVPSLQYVAYARLRDPSGVRESSNLMHLLLALAKQAHLMVEIIGRDKLYDDMD